jgi:hypothetical protein
LPAKTDSLHLKKEQRYVSENSRLLIKAKEKAMNRNIVEELFDIAKKITE